MLSCAVIFLLLYNHQVSSLTNNIGQLAPQHIFNVDFTWSPANPTINDTVVFKVVIKDDSFMASKQLWDSLPEENFKWYKQLPSAGYFLQKLGRTYIRKADEPYFEGLYKLEVTLPSLLSVATADNKVSVKNNSPSQVEEENIMNPESEINIEIPKYVGLQKHVQIALFFNSVDARKTQPHTLISEEVSWNVTCRYWGKPWVPTLQMLLPKGSICSGQTFRNFDNEAHVDLISKCSRLTFGTYSCFGSNAVSASQLSCEMNVTNPEGRCYSPILWQESEQPQIKTGNLNLGNTNKSGTNISTTVYSILLLLVLHSVVYMKVFIL